MTIKLSNDKIFMAMALVAAGGSTCIRRAVGCILVNKYDHIIAVGRNGVPRNFSHCLNNPCEGANAPSGTNLNLCSAVHSEDNALIQCKTPMEIETAYVTASPCVSCVKSFMNTSCKRIVFMEEYPQPKAKELWLKLNSVDSWIHLPFDNMLENIKMDINIAAQRKPSHAA